MLQDAIDRARKLVMNLQRQKQELEAAPPTLPPDQLKEGMQAFDNALASARRMLTALEQAAAIAPQRPPDLSQDTDPS